MEAVGEVGEVGEEGALDAEAFDRGGFGGGAFLDRCLERGGVVGDGGEGVGHLCEQDGVDVRDGGDLGGRAAELEEELVELGVRVGE